MNYQTMRLNFGVDAEDSDPITLYFDIGEDILSQAWADALRYNVLLPRRRAERYFAPQGFLTREDGRTVAEVFERLRSEVVIINRYFTGRYAIQDLDEELENPGLAIASTDNVFFHKLHKHFEILIGQVHSVSPWYQQADNRTRLAIRQLNNICHEMEVWSRSLTAFANDELRSWMILNFNGASANRQVIPLGYKTDTQIVFNWGDVKLHYAQLGKTHFEAALDNDELVGEENLSEPLYYTGEFDVSFCHFKQPFEQVDTYMHGVLHKWCAKRGLSLNQKFGYPVVARINHQQTGCYESEVVRFTAEELWPRPNLMSIGLDGMTWRLPGDDWRTDWMDDAMDALKEDSALSTQAVAR